MKRTHPQAVGEIMKELLQQYGIENQFDEQRVVYLWPQVVGQGINRYTASRWVKDGVLHLHITSAVLRNELMMARTALIDRLNEAAGAPVIHDIVIR